jgi:hypothetical protein
MRKAKGYEATESRCPRKPGKGEVSSKPEASSIDRPEDGRSSFVWYRIFLPGGKRMARVSGRWEQLLLGPARALGNSCRYPGASTEFNAGSIHVDVAH